MNFHPTVDAFRSYLLSGERVLWTGQPKQGLALSAWDALLVPFSLLWGGFAIIWNIMVWAMPIEGEQPDLFFRLFGLPFLVAGFYIMIGRFFHDAAIRKKIHYAVTDQRVLILRGLRSSTIRSLDLHRLPRLELSEHRDGTGTIQFDGSNSIFSANRMNGFSTWVPSLGGTSQFFRINDPRRVYELIRNQAHS